MIANLNGVYQLNGRVARHLGLDPRDTLSYFFTHVISAISGEKTYKEALDSIEVVNTSMYYLIDALQNFDYALYINADVPFPDYTEIDENGEDVIISMASFSELAKEAWGRMQEADYIEGLFCLSVLAGIFMTSYPDEVVDLIDMSPLLEPYVMLKRGILAKKMEEEYDEHRG